MRFRTDRPKILWRSLSRAGQVRLVLAIFLTFSTLGFVTDLFQLREPMTPAALVFRVIYSGLVAVAYFLAVTRSTWFIPIALVFHLGGAMVIDRIAPRAVLAAGALLDIAAVQRRVTIDGVGVILVIALAYMFFIHVLTSEGMRRTRLLAEMALARDIHNSLVPMIALEHPGYEIFGRSSPSSEVGGDLVDALVQDDAVTVCVADVSGHGVRAGTLMAMVRSALRMKLLGTHGLAGLLDDLNQVLMQLERPDIFVTLACLRLDPGSRVESALAGHLPVLHVRADGTTSLIENRNVPLGVRSGERYPIASATVAPGDLLVLYTDGLTEVRDREDREFGAEALTRAIVEQRQRPLAELFDHVMDAVHRHGKQIDDQTLLLVRVRATA